jgi:hypothetical protein
MEPWVAVAMAVVAALGLWPVVQRARAQPEPPMPLSFDDEAVRWAGTSIRWDELAEVTIVTTEEGPFVDDVFWVLRAADGRELRVPSETAGDLLGRLQELPGFDNEAVIRSMGSTENARFVAWRR